MHSIYWYGICCWPLAKIAFDLSPFAASFAAAHLNFSRPPALSEVGFNVKLTATATKLFVLFVTGGINRGS